MTGTNILIACVALIGFLPLVVYLYGKRRANRILATGHRTTGVVARKTVNRKSNYEVVHYQFVGPDRRYYEGHFTTRPGVYRRTDAIDVYYLPGNPAAHTVKGTYKGQGVLLFMVAIAVAVLLMMYQLWKDMNSGGT